jgi:O-antigen/teichoic acid export membrane protein
MKSVLSATRHWWYSYKQSLIWRNLLRYGLSSLLVRALQLLATPLTLHLLQPADYGLLALFYSFNNLAVIFLGLGLRQALYIEFFHQDSAGQKKIINDILIMYCSIGIPLLTLCFFYTDHLNYYFFQNAANTVQLTVCLTSSFIYFFSELFLQLLSLSCKTLLLTAITSISSVLVLMLTLLLLWQGFGATGLMISFCMGIIINAVIGCSAYLSTETFKHLYVPKIYSRGLSHIKKGFPFIPSLLAAWILASSDRWVLARYTTLHIVGIYSTVDAFGQLFYVVITQTIINAYVPQLLKKFSESDSLEIIEQENKKILLRFMAAMIGALTLGFVLFKPLFFLMLPTKYHQAIPYIWMNIMGYIFLTGSHFNLGLILFAKKSHFQALALMLTATINLLLNVSLVGSYGISGCITATTISYFCYFGLTAAYNRRALNQIFKHKLTRQQ